MTEHKITIERDVEIPMRDGVVLRGDLWLPAEEGPHPAVLFRTAYNKALYNFDVLRPANCVDRGYAAIVQDTRGRFASDGEWQAILWEQEGRDTYDSVEWVAEQGWCDGNVGMAGPSYLGIVQWLGAMERPPHLRAIAPAMSTSAEHDAAETGGAVRLDHLVTWLVFVTGTDWLRRQMAAGEEVDPATIATIVRYATHPSEAMEVLPLTDLLDVPGFPITMADILSKGVENAPHFDLSRVDIPTLGVGGWYDVFCNATMALHTEIAERDPDPGRHCVVMGPWAHGAAFPHTQGELNFGLAAAGHHAQLPDKHLDFFDVHLRGVERSLDRVHYFLANANEWRTAAEWPPAGASATAWYLSSGGQASTVADDGRLVEEAVDGDQLPDTFDYDPADPVPSHGGRVLFLGDLVGGPLAQNHIEQRPDVCCYTSERLDQPVDAVGPVSVALHASSSARDTDFMAKLVDVFPDGRAIVVADGVIRARYRKGMDNEQLVDPGSIEDYEINLGHIAWRFAPGHRLRVDITSSNFPHIDRNMNTGEPIGSDVAGMAATQEIHHSAAHPSRLSLTCLPDASGGA